MTWTRIERHNYEDEYQIERRSIWDELLNRSGHRETVIVKKSVIYAVEYRHSEYPEIVSCKIIQKVPDNKSNTPQVSLELSIGYVAGSHSDAASNSYYICEGIKRDVIEEHTIERNEYENMVTYHEYYQTKTYNFNNQIIGDFDFRSLTFGIQHWECLVSEHPLAKKHTCNSHLHSYLIKSKLIEAGSDIDFEICKLFRLYKKDEEIFNKLLSYVKSEDIEIAIEKAKEFQDEQCYYEPIWQLALFLENEAQQPSANINLDFIYQVFRDISEQNPHFREAQEKMFAMNMLIPCANNDYLEERFKAAFQSQTEEETTNHLFHQLCGNNDLLPTVKITDLIANKNAIINVEPLCAVAAEMRALHAQIEVLRREKEEFLSYKTRIEAGKAAKVRKKFNTGLFKGKEKEKEKEEFTKNDDNLHPN